MIQGLLAKVVLNKYVISTVIVGVLTWGIKSYYTHTENKLDALTATVQEQKTDIENLKAELQSRDDLLNELRKDIENQIARSRELEERNREAVAYQRDLRHKLQRHDLTYLALMKPGLIEKRINDATKNVFNELENITASPDS